MAFFSSWSFFGGIFRERRRGKVKKRKEKIEADHWLRSRFWQQTYKDAFEEELGGLHSRRVVTEEVAPIVLQVLGICEGNHRDDQAGSEPDPV